MPTASAHLLLLTASVFLGLIANAFSFCPHATPSHHAAASRTTTSLASTLTNSDVAAPDEDRRRRDNLPAPPCPRSNPSDDLFRGIRNSWPVWLQNVLRESGLLRSMEDTLILLAVPELLQTYPQALANFWDLTKRTSKIQYGDHEMQYMDLIEPPESVANGKPPDGVVTFVHGGAWGSGKPWMYRLAALPFLESNKAVAVLGYRTYPDADVDGQVEDIGLSLNVLARERPDLLDDHGKVESMVCHSSGSHIGLLHILEAAKASAAQKGQTMMEEAEQTQIGQFVGISGVYCIPSHYEYEKGRGVDQLSSLRAANGPGQEGFRQASPAYRLECFVGANGEEQCVLLDDAEGNDGDTMPVRVKLDDHVPDMLFIHGVNDNVVQYNQTSVVVDALRSSLGDPDRCEEVLLESVAHADTVIHLMFGGVTRDVVLGGCGWGARRSDNGRNQ